MRNCLLFFFNILIDVTWKHFQEYEDIINSATTIKRRKGPSVSTEIAYPHQYDKLEAVKSLRANLPKGPNKKLFRRCWVCEFCLRKDCGKCANCLDMPRFGGVFKLKQACLERQCIFPLRLSKQSGCNQATPPCVSSLTFVPVMAYFIFNINNSVLDPSSCFS